MRDMVAHVGIVVGQENPLPNIYNASKGLADYDFYTPYGKDSAQSNLLSFAGAQSGGLLGANQDLCVLDASACQVA